MINNKTQLIEDPSNIKQLFPNYNLQLLCCRHWWLKHWEFKDLSFPYWRLYYNNHIGAKIIWKGKTICLSPDKIYLVAPNTSYSTQLYNHKIAQKEFHLEGERITSDGAPPHSVAHFFIHFSLGFPYDRINPGIFSIEANDRIQQQIGVIKTHLKKDHVNFDFITNLAIRSLINDLLCNIHPENWNKIGQDRRIIGALDYIENNITEELSNPILAEKVQLATNSFTRLFTEEMSISPQRYVKQQRVNKACILLHHTNVSIDVIASETGFADRYHFSRIFKEYTNISPALYRKLN